MHIILHDCLRRRELLTGSTSSSRRICPINIIIAVCTASGRVVVRWQPRVVGLRLPEGVTP